MQKWRFEDFENNNRKLKNYLDNVENAIVALCVNDIGAQNYLCGVLENEFQYSGIDLRKSNISFLHILDTSLKQGKNKLFFYNLVLENSNYDLIKTMNLSRDILRKIGIVVLIIPTFIMKKIQADMPNLNDYITLKLDYNIEYKCPLYPIYSEEHRNFLPNSIRIYKKNNAIKNAVNPSQIRSLAQYYDYLELKQYTGLKKSDVNFAMKWLFEDMKEGLDAAQYFQKDLDPFTEVAIDAYYRTAMLLQTYGYYQYAIKLYDEIIYLRKNTLTNDISDLEALQGKCYCFYKLGEYERTSEMLGQLLAMLDGFDNLPWKYKVYNDLGVCYYHIGKYEDAYAIWKQCETKLQGINEYNVKRRLRILYNQKLVSEHIRVNCDRCDERWNKLGHDLVHDGQGDSLIYFQYMLMNSWLHFQKGDLLRAENNILETYSMSKKLFSENDAMLIDVYYIWALISLQLGKEDLFDELPKKGKQLMKNHEGLEYRYAK